MMKRTAAWCVFLLFAVIYTSFYVENLYVLGLCVAAAITLGHKMTILSLMMEDRELERERNRRETDILSRPGPPASAQRDWFGNNVV